MTVTAKCKKWESGEVRGAGRRGQGAESKVKKMEQAEREQKK